MAKNIRRKWKSRLVGIIRSLSKTVRQGQFHHKAMNWIYTPPAAPHSRVALSVVVFCSTVVSHNRTTRGRVPVAWMLCQYGNSHRPRSGLLDTASLYACAPCPVADARR